MMRIAEKISNNEGSAALITGESIGQVASQTMESLVCTDNAVNQPVFRPCIGMDKEEIVAISKKIGTYSFAIVSPSLLRRAAQFINNERQLCADLCQQFIGAPLLFFHVVRCLYSDRLPNFLDNFGGFVLRLGSRLCLCVVPCLLLRKRLRRHHVFVFHKRFGRFDQ